MICVSKESSQRTIEGTEALRRAFCDIKKLDEVMVLQDDNTISINGVLSDDNIIAAEDMISVEKILGLTEDNIASDVMEEER
ncbi:unnamed protein product [Acanthocheilonema viteae]|uniref:Uncharacterized protein n=1 Tax=Acanthocheilonema viteae TaxID=6277 RepID=A0A498SNA8_ACAVI|nr:unnamed protein product [Acanthocheilonema viteae]